MSELQSSRTKVENSPKELLNRKETPVPSSFVTAKIVSFELLFLPTSNSKLLFLLAPS